MSVSNFSLYRKTKVFAEDKSYSIICSPMVIGFSVISTDPEIDYSVILLL